jgi:hypothetical protein
MHKTLRFISRVLFAAVMWITLPHALAIAQTGNSSVSGSVADPDGGVIVHATVRVFNRDTLVKRETKTDANGNYRVPALPLGHYQIVVEAEGFGPRSSEVITLTGGEDFAFNARMVVGSIDTQVEVSETSARVELDTASISTTITQEEVTGYGLNGRNFSQLITMAPGVSNQTGQDEAKVGVAGSAKFSVNGGRVEYNTFEVDGSDVLNTSINASRGQGEPLMVYPSIDAIQDMKVLTADYSAIYGKSASGSVLISTKSGTSAFHGNVYGFLRNEMFNARNYFDQPEPVPAGYTGKRIYKTPLYRRIDAGATLGGPLFIPHFYNTSKTKTFFFFSEEIRREKTPVDYNQAVPTMDERSGVFTDVCPAIIVGAPTTFNPANAPDCPVGQLQQSGLPLIGNTVVPDSTTVALLNTGIIPEPNSASGCNSTNFTPFLRCYTASVSPPTHYCEELFRIDHNLTPSETLSFRYIHDSWDTITLAPQWGVVHNSFPTVENVLNGPGLDMVLSLAQTLPRDFINRIAFSYAVEHITLAPQAGVGLTSLNRPQELDDSGPGVTGGAPVSGSSGLCSTVSAVNECPMGHIFDNGYGGDKMPGLVFQGNNGAYGGHGFAADTGCAPWNQANPTFDLRDDASKTIGKHVVQFGFEGTYVQQNEQSAVSGANSGDLQGLLTFSNQQSTGTTGNAFADFLAGSSGSLQGAVKSYTQDSGLAKYYNRYKAADLYLQDDWHVTPRLTVNTGVRVSLFGTWFNAKNTAFNWRPEAFSSFLANTINVDPNFGYLVNVFKNQPVPLDVINQRAITNGLQQCGVKGVPSSCMAGSVFHPAPRVGFSWDPSGNGRTAIRGGYGLFWEHGTGYEANSGSLIGSAPMVLSETQSNIVASRGTDQYGRIGFSCQGGTAQCGNAIPPPGGVTFPLNVTSIPTKAIYSYVQQWSLSVQQQVGKTLVAQMAYVGTRGVHLTAVQDLNQLQPLSNGLNPFPAGQPITPTICQSATAGGPFSVGNFNVQGIFNIPNAPGISPEQAGYTNMVVACSGNPGFATGAGKLGLSADSVRPYPGFSNIIAVRNVADSQYHALQATLRQTAGPLTLGLAYTYSHSLDDASDRSSANFANSLDFHSNHASSDFDERHILNVNYVYDLPLVQLLQRFTRLVGNGSDSADDTSWVPGSRVKAWLGGWQLSGITAYETGTPFSVINGGGSDGTAAADNAGVGNGLGIGSYADVISDAKSGKPFVAPSSNNVGPLLLNPGAFVAPRGLTFGNSGRNFLRNPSRINFNMSLFKHFKPLQGLDIEFRAEAYNVFNHTQFRITDPANPGNTGNNIVNCYGSTSEQVYSAGASKCLAGNSFLHPVDAHDPRILQFGLKGQF